MKTKVFVMGLDGATFDLIRPWKRFLPNISNIMSEGVSGNLISTVPPITCPAWLSFMTGKNPGELGIYDFLEHEPGRYGTKLVNPSHIRLKSQAIWDVLSDEGLSVGVFNVPCTYPPNEVNGFMVSGMLTPSEKSDFTFPKQLKAELNRVVDGYPLDTLDRRDEDEFLSELHRNLQKREQAVKYLMKQYDPDFLIAVFRETDIVQHFMWRHMDPTHLLHDSNEPRRYRNSIREVWETIDRIIGDFLTILDESTTVILMSDHGFGKREEIFYVNNWLERSGYLRLKVGIRLRLHLSSLLRRIGFRDQPLAFGRLINWHQTRAYSPRHTSAFGQIYINLRGREPNGIVSPEAEYEELRNELIEELCKLENPANHKRMRTQAFRREEIYSGQFLEKAPDIVYLLDDLTCIQDPSLIPRKIVETKSSREQNATHRMNGILVAKGPKIKKDRTIGNAHITDVAPTILHMMNVAVPEGMKGKVLREMLENSST